MAELCGTVIKRGLRPTLKLAENKFSSMIPRVAFIFTHRIQYFTNLMEELHRRGKFKVAAFYAHETAKIQDTGFGRRIKWDNRKRTEFSETIFQDSARREFGPFFNSWSRELFAGLNEFSPHILHLNGYSNAIQWQAWFWAAHHHIPMVARCDGDILGGTQRSKLSPKRVLARLFTRRLAHVLYQGTENQKFWLERGASPKQMSWIPCVSDSEVFRKKAFESTIERNSFRATHNTNPQDIVFITSGKFEQRKRQADAIEALARCAAENVRLWFLGSGPLETELRALAALRGVESKITWFGFRNQTESSAVLQAADVLLHPAEKDPWPYSVLEGAISGLALLLSDKVGSHPDWSEPPSTCIVFPCGDKAKLAIAMKRFIQDRNLLADLRHLARLKADQYTESEFCNRFEASIFNLADLKKEFLIPGNFISK
jgi:glycosyltransferase involved in cell wall biosynthesis